MIGLPPVVTLTGPRAASIAADRAASRARDVFAPGALERRVAAELSPPAVYDELHAVVPTLASAAPGGRVVCWSDDEALWARRFDARDGNAGPLATAPRAVIELQSCGFGADADPGAETQFCTTCRRCSGVPRGGGCSCSWRCTSPPRSTCSRCISGWCGTRRRRGWRMATRRIGTRTSPGTLSRGRWHVPSLAFSQDCLPIFEQYAQTHSLWNPGRARLRIRRGTRWRTWTRWRCSTFRNARRSPERSRPR